ncbi:hypothetical protein D3C73_922670 [compost metagenome]
MNAAELHHHTPGLAVIDSHGLAVRGVGYWREEVGQAAAARATRQVFDGVGRLAEQWVALLRAVVESLGQPGSRRGVDGLSFYCFVRHSPMSRLDADGRNSDRGEDERERSDSDWQKQNSHPPDGYSTIPHSPR